MAYFCPGKLAALLVPEFAMIHDFQIKLFEKGEIVSKREGWDEEWREVGRSHSWQLPPPCPMATAPLGYQVRASRGGLGPAHTTSSTIVIA